ncbi:hypothetical protein GPECTOR_2g1247 [Gonium pectorale]|uniref:Uncharacterized protein n=1 Tax=Gonium pectorale TaxID=33097 RepID=A0A150H0K1_GONPE|nr:hypothetical protein GPECTOR_2g1247 [Gonium pectorale]|eukprot:KXZ55697.1 hypothetical protein GPECTOR_2g1247 [Gonium pectorale]
MKLGGSLEEGRQVIIPIRHGPGGAKPSAEQTKSFGHKDSILVGLGLVLFLSLTWIYFVHRMYLNVEETSSPVP